MNVQVTLKLPATKRAPVVNDLIVSEFFVVANDKDSSQYNFVEFYNGSTDTLVLDKCTLGKTSSVTGAAEINTLALPPNEVLVGRVFRTFLKRTKKLNCSQ